MFAPYYIIKYTCKENDVTGTIHVGIARTRRFFELVEKLRSHGFIVKTQLIE